MTLIVAIHCPDEWTPEVAKILARRLADDELPDGIMVEVAETDESVGDTLYLVRSGC